MKEPYEDDDVLLRDLAQAWDEVADLVPGATAAGRGAFTWRTIDTDLQLATLSFDSALDGAGAVRAGTTTGEGEPRVLVFSVSLQAVEVEVLADRVLGQFLPPEPGTVVVETEDGRGDPVEVDEVGFFELRPAPRGMVRLHCQTATTRLLSSWVRL